MRLDLQIQPNRNKIGLDDIGKEMTPKLGRGTLEGEFRSFTFTGSSLDSMVVFFKPGAGRGLWGRRASSGMVKSQVYPL